MPINDRLMQVVRIYQKLGIVGDEVDEYDNVQFMKLLYLFFIEYINQLGVFYGKPGCFRDFRFYAYKRGPVEDFVYGNIGIIRSILKKIQNQVVEWGEDLFPGGDAEALNHASDEVVRKYLWMDTDTIVDFTHFRLKEWRFTPIYSEMTFPFGYQEECEAAAAYNPA